MQLYFSTACSGKIVLIIVYSPLLRCLSPLSPGVLSVSNRFQLFSEVVSQLLQTDPLRDVRPSQLPSQFADLVFPSVRLASITLPFLLLCANSFTSQCVHNCCQGLYLSPHSTLQCCFQHRIQVLV